MSGLRQRRVQPALLGEGSIVDTAAFEDREVEDFHCTTCFPSASRLKYSISARWRSTTSNSSPFWRSNPAATSCHCLLYARHFSRRSWVCCSLMRISTSVICFGIGCLRAMLYHLKALHTLEIALRRATIIVAAIHLDRPHVQPGLDCARQCISDVGIVRPQVIPEGRRPGQRAPAVAE